MASQDSFQYDAFVSYNQADEEWAHTWLLPRLEADGVRVVTEADFESGSAQVVEIERAIRSSRCTVAILTPDWLRSNWNNYEIVLSQTQNLSDLKRKIIPVLLKPCEIPFLLRHLVAADLTDESKREKRVRALAQDIFGRSWVPTPNLPRQGEDWQAFWPQLRRWLRRHQQLGRWGAAAGFLLLLLLLMGLQIGPFRPAPGWRDLGFRGSGAYNIARVGDALLVSSDTAKGNCFDAVAMWRSTDAGATWPPVSVSELCFDLVRYGQQWAAVRAFAPTWSPTLPHAPPRLYGITSDLGVIVSTDAGVAWQLVLSPDFPRDPKYLAASATTPNLLMVAPYNKPGLYRSRDGGVSFTRLDGVTTCSNADAGLTTLPTEFVVGALLATDAGFIVGSDVLDRRSPGAGLYVSRDGGDCWLLLEDSAATWGYEAMAAIPGRADAILVAVRDGTFGRDQASDFLYRYNIAAAFAGPRRLMPLLWKGNTAVSSLFVGADDPPIAYAASEFGVVYYGPVDQPAAWAETTRFLTCLLSCEVRLAPDVQGARPLLLADQRIFRWDDHATWLRRWWP